MPKATQHQMSAQIREAAQQYNPSDECIRHLYDYYGLEKHYVESTLNVEALREAVYWAISEVEAASASGAIDYPEEESRAGAWDQSNWASITVPKEYKPTSIVVDPDTDYGATNWVPVTCLSTGCIAGHTVVAAGDTILVAEDEAKARAGGVVTVAYCKPVNGPVTMISQRAEEILGLSTTEADCLFNGSNTIGDVIDYAYQIAEAHGQEL